MRHSHSPNHTFRDVPREVSAVFPVFLRGGPELVGDANARLVDEGEAAAVIEREAAGGTLVRFHLTGDYVLIDGQERRVYDFDSSRSG
ncbi:hypothetical protein KDL01_16215 [Actinospica durhamensis]|uniref:Uncharacterized protein n=1 Tax=Actinospica durhamensis TaxID=1508375 RepID=A0A941IR22_9ACTN|nr:hypothetical protein [Actinospica durhamensis]MBR7834822.1 hypothetical protein [Actinospica durhamensis]